MRKENRRALYDGIHGGIFQRGSGTDVPCFPMLDGRWMDGRKVDLSRLPPMLSPKTWAASSQAIGELSQHQGLHVVVLDIQTSKPFEAWLNVDKNRADELLERWSKRLILNSKKLHQVQSLVMVRSMGQLDEECASD